MKKNIAIALITIFLITVIITGCKKEVTKKPIVIDNNQINLDIMTTNKFVYNMVMSIVKDKHTVDFMFKSEQDQWNFNYTDDSVGNISRKDMFIYYGLNFEPWIGDFLNDLSGSKTAIINVSRGTTVINRDDPAEYDDKSVKENPYCWMNVNNYVTGLSNIVEAISEKDPQNRSFYQKNFAEERKKLDLVQGQMKNVLQKLKDYTFVVQGDRLDYFLKYNDMKYVKLPSDFDYSTAKLQSDNKIIKKLHDSKKMVFLYSEDDEDNENKDIIKDMGMIRDRIYIYNPDFKYADIIKMNCNDLQKIIK